MSETKEGQNQSDNKKGEDKKGNKALAIGGLIIILALTAVVAVLASRLRDVAKTENDKETTATQKDVITPENVNEVIDDMRSTPENNNVPKYYTVVQNTEWTFPDGSSESVDAYVENDADNESPVYFNLIVDATGEIVYSSPVLSLGAKIQNFKLDKPLPAGRYECTTEYHLVDEQQNELTTVNIETYVTVLK